MYIRFQYALLFTFAFYSLPLFQIVGVTVFSRIWKCHISYHITLRKSVVTLMNIQDLSADRVRAILYQEITMIIIEAG